MLKIKLTRTGKTHEPRYRIVANEARDKATGKYLVKLGHYNPITKELVVDRAMYADLLKKGAQPTDTVRNLMARTK